MHFNVTQFLLNYSCNFRSSSILECSRRMRMKMQWEWRPENLTRKEVQKNCHGEPVMSSKKIWSESYSRGKNLVTQKTEVLSSNDSSSLFKLSVSSFLFYESKKEICQNRFFHPELSIFIKWKLLPFEKDWKKNHAREQQRPLIIGPTRANHLISPN